MAHNLMSYHKGGDMNLPSLMVFLSKLALHKDRP